MAERSAVALAADTVIAESTAPDSAIENPKARRATHNHTAQGCRPLIF